MSISSTFVILTFTSLSVKNQLKRDFHIRNLPNYKKISLFYIFDLNLSTVFLFLLLTNFYFIYSSLFLFSFVALALWMTHPSAYSSLRIYMLLALTLQI